MPISCRYSSARDSITHLSMKKVITFLSLFIVLSFPQVIHAHAVVKPTLVSSGSFETFIIQVPNEEDTPTSRITLVIPDSVSEVIPEAKPGWKITKQAEKDNESHITEITWANGIIPVGEEETFTFHARVPSETSTLVWKIYQTYKSGKTISWDQESSSHEENGENGPASHTQVIVNLGTPQPTPIAGVGQSNKNVTTFSTISLVLSVIALVKVLSLSKRS